MTCIDNYRFMGKGIGCAPFLFGLCQGHFTGKEHQAAMNEIYSSTASFQFRRDSKRGVTFFNHTLRAFAIWCVLAANAIHAQNLLVNPGFESPPYGHSTNLVTPAFGWTYFSPPEPPTYFGDYWVDNAVMAHSGTYYWKEWFALGGRDTNNVAGIYQTLSSAPGSTYQASGWLYINSADAAGPNGYIWLQVEFLNSSSNLLALYKSENFSASAGENHWFQYQVTNVCDLSQPQNISPWFNTYAVTGSVSQLVAPAGSATVLYRYCYFAAVGDGGSSYFDDADLDQLSGPIPPEINNLFPQNMIFVPPASGVSFNVSSPSGHVINTNAVHLVSNGVDVSKTLTFTGNNASNTSTNLNVFFHGLQSNTAYNVSITVTDSLGFTASVNTYFETTWFGVQAPTYLWEAEDWDFTNGMYYDDPTLCNTCCESNCYFGVVGTQGVDEYTSVYVSGANYHVYRPQDMEGTALSEDYTRPNLFAASREDYCINPFNYTDWVNYTRDWPNSTNWIIGRFANGSGSAGGCTLSLVTSTATNVLGTFTVNPGASWSAFQYVYLANTNNGQNANVILNGKETLQLSAILPGGGGGNCLPTFFMLVPAVVDLPYLTGLYPRGNHPFEYTNALSFTVTTLGATFLTNEVILDGNNVSSGLIITGSASSNNVVYPNLAPNEMHTAVINVTNSLGHGISVTYQFDTFSQSNYMFEAEDYDYNGGQYVPSASYTPDCYTSFESFTNIDFHHTPVGETTGSYQYRINGIPQQAADDYLRQEYINSFSADYQLYYYGGGDWANYTRDYPPGSYYLYARTSGLGLYTMTLGQVVSGQGTTNQVVKQLGQWSAEGVNINTFAWVPLTDAGGVAPVVVRLSGVPTLQVGTPTGDCYPNYFMLVPASGIKLSASKSGNNVHISFPTQAGFTYRVFYRTNLTAGSWNLLSTVLGNGAVVSVTGASTAGNQQFYEVTAP